jgi:hypothetical protein
MEHYLKFKRFMHNKVILEGSMAKGYELNKVLQFFIEYLTNFIPTR